MIEEGAIINDLFVERLNYLIYVVLLLIGLHAMISKKNLIKKLIGMSIFQTAIILFYVSISVKDGATIPIYKAHHDPHGEKVEVQESDSNQVGDKGFKSSVQALHPHETPQYANPLPHVLMLTAIVVGVATLGLALALCLRIYQGYGTIEEDVLLSKIEAADSRSSSSPVAGGNAPRRFSKRIAKTQKPAGKQVAKAPEKKSSQSLGTPKKEKPKAARKKGKAPAENSSEKKSSSAKSTAKVPKGEKGTS